MAVFLGVSLYRGYIVFVESEGIEQTKFLGMATVTSDFSSDAYVTELCDLLKKGAFGLKKRYEGVVFSIHSGREIYRKMQFPFGREQVEKTVNFEFYDQIRDAIKLELEDVGIDHLVLSSTEKSTQILALAAPLRPLTRVVEGVEKYDMDPERVIPEISGLQSFIAGKIPLYASGKGLGLHTTPDGVFIYFLQNGVPAEIRFLKLKLGEVTAETASEKPTPSPTVSNDQKMPEKVVSEFEEDEEFFTASSLVAQEINELAQKSEEKDEPSAEETQEETREETPTDENKTTVIKRILIQLKRTSFLLADLPTDILITGVHAYDKELLASMNVLGLKVYKDDNVDFKHATAIGASISFFQKELEVFNLRKGALAYKGFFEKIVGPLNWCILLLILVTACMTVFLHIEKEKAVSLQNKYTKYALDIKEQVDPGTELKRFGVDAIVNVKLHMDTLNKLLDFEANSDRYEKKHPIISCLRVWLEYERTLKRAFEKEKLTINSEKDLTIRQGTSDVILSVNDAKSVNLVELEKFLGLLNVSGSGFFSSAIQTGNSRDPATDMVVFDIVAKKNYVNE